MVCLGISLATSQSEMSNMQLTHFMNAVHLMLYMAEEYIQMCMYLYTYIT